MFSHVIEIHSIAHPNKDELLWIRAKCGSLISVILIDDELPTSCMAFVIIERNITNV